MIKGFPVLLILATLSSHSSHANGFAPELSCRTVVTGKWDSSRARSIAMPGILALPAVRYGQRGIYIYNRENAYFSPLPKVVNSLIAQRDQLTEQYRIYSKKVQHLEQTNHVSDAAYPRLIREMNDVWTKEFEIERRLSSEGINISIRLQDGSALLVRYTMTGKNAEVMPAFAGQQNSYAAVLEEAPDLAATKVLKADLERRISSVSAKVATADTYDRPSPDDIADDLRKSCVPLKDRALHSAALAQVNYFEAHSTRQEAQPAHNPVPVPSVEVR